MIWQRKQRFPVDTVSMLLMHLHSRITLKMQLIYIFLSTAKSKHTFCGSDAHKKEKMLRKLIFFCSVIEWKSQFYFKVMLLCMFLKCAERKWENFCFKVKKNFVKSEKLCGFSMRERKKMGKFKVSTNWFNNFPSRLLMDNFQTLTTKDDQQIALNILNALREWKLAQVAQAFSSQHFFLLNIFSWRSIIKRNRFFPHPSFHSNRQLCKHRERILTVKILAAHSVNNYMNWVGFG